MVPLISIKIASLVGTFCAIIFLPNPKISINTENQRIIISDIMASLFQGAQK